MEASVPNESMDDAFPAIATAESVGTRECTSSQPVCSTMESSVIRPDTQPASSSDSQEKSDGSNHAASSKERMGQKADSQEVGEMGAASGLYMLSRSRGDSPDSDDRRPEPSSDTTHRKRSYDEEAGHGESVTLSSSQTTPPTSNRPIQSEVRQPTDIPSPSSSNKQEKPRKVSTEGSTVHESETDSKRKSFLERNRQAAYKCRQRKKAWLASLQAKVEYLQSDNESLQNTVEALRSEVLFLKSQLMQQHALSNALDNESKSSSEHVNRSLPATFPSVDISMSGGAVVGYSDQGSSHPLISPISTVGPVGSQTGMTGQGMDNELPTVPPTETSMQSYNMTGLSRMPQITSPHALISDYRPTSQAYSNSHANE
ncbi:Transcription factor [Malassezia pachydermatis]